MPGKPRSERVNTTAKDIGGTNCFPSPQSHADGLSTDPGPVSPGSLDEALRDALRATDRMAVVIVNLDTGESKTAFVM